MATSKVLALRDTNGRRIRSGNRVRFLAASSGLLRGLPVSDRRAILGAVGGVYRVQDLNGHGHAEIEFVEPNGTMHFVWVEPENLRVVRSGGAKRSSHLTARSKGTRKKASRAPHRGR